MRIRKYGWALIVVMMLLVGCATQNSHVLSGGSAVELRSFQTRAFDTTDKHKMMRTTIAVLQDLGFIIDKTDEDLGLVTGTKLSGYQIRMTVIVQPRGEKQLAVRASAIYNNRALEDPLPYQDFFTALEKGIFLTAQE
ncbi:MAG: hypothetical protein KAQ71_05110, partial [Desulfobulbaceae bacterium]|nr:hypothetical protein [Desulfobulbaceae bacterium]